MKALSLAMVWIFSGAYRFNAEGKCRGFWFTFHSIQAHVIPFPFVLMSFLGSREALYGSKPVQLTFVYFTVPTKKARMGSH